MSAAARAQQRVGDEIAGKYRLTRLLGAGGMGAVYEAVHQFTQRRVAVKLMHASFSRSGVAAERFVREAQAPTSIGHAGIVEILDGGHDQDGSLYLVLELLEGETLGDAIKTGALEPHQVAAIGLQLLDALEAAHAAGFVHRDIKPENVFLVPDEGEQPRVKLLDFGVAGVLSAETKPGLTVAGAVLGTPLYMSPEQALGRRVDARSDLWSVGAVMYQALTGRAPFGGDSFQALVVSIATQEILPLSVLRPELPVRLAAVVERALQKNAEQRWQSAADMAQALERARLHGRREPVGERARAPGPPEPPPAATASLLHAPEVRTLPAWLAPLVGVALLVLGAALWIALKPRPQPGRPARNDAPAPAHPPQAELRTGAAAPRAAPLETKQTHAAPGDADDRQPAHAAPAAGLTHEQLAHVLETNQGALQRCYEDAVATELLQRGAGAGQQIEPLRLDLGFEVGANGETHDIELTGSASAEMKRCATGAVRAWRFPQAAGPTQVRLPVIFQPNVVQR